MSDKLQKRNAGWSGSIVNELYQDVIGSLFSGMIVVMLCFFMIFMMIYIPYVANFFKDNKLNYDIFSSLSKIHIEISVLYIALSFVVGTILCRQDINIPSAISSFMQFYDSSEKDRVQSGVYLANEISYEDIKKLYKFGIFIIDKSNKIVEIKNNSDISTKVSVDGIKTIDCVIFREKKITKEYLKIFLLAKINRFINVSKYKDAILTILHAKFPFPGMRCFLFQRGRNELADNISWCRKLPETFEHCSKTYVNDTKTKVMILNQNLFNILNKTEAQIKMINTAWYSLRIILYVSFFTFIISLLYKVYYCFVNIENTILYKYIYWDAWLTLSILFLGYISLSKVTKIIHSIRIREVVLIASYRAELGIDKDTQTKLECCGCEHATNTPPSTSST